ncbi:tetratricopeptide repeat protein [Sulfurospirillum sp. 1612]|uniref:tetratricopeptide repeat protein n=1 Tax=Sulfurospirillum sp. 1612 TaxID=3094835 RepID=UPI002F934E6C
MDNSVYYIMLIGIIIWIYSLFSVISNEFQNNNKLIWIILLIFLPFSALLYIFIGKKQIVKNNIESTSQPQGKKKSYDEFFIFLAFVIAAYPAVEFFYYIIEKFRITPEDYFGNIGKIVILGVLTFVFSIPALLLIEVLKKIILLIIAYIKSKEFKKILIIAIISGILFIFLGTGYNVYDRHIKQANQVQKLLVSNELFQAKEYLSQKEYQKAFKLYTVLAEKNIPEAQFQLGKLYFQSNIPEGNNYQEAFVWIHKAALNGNKSAEEALSYMYEKGYGVKQDLNQSKHWHQKSEM